MQEIRLSIDEELLRKARQHASENDATLEALLAEYLAVLADSAGRRLTVREQIYVDYRPSGEVIERLRAEGYPRKQKAR